MKNDLFLQILYYVMNTSSVIWQSWRGLETRNKKRERSSQERSKARKSCLRFLHVHIISNVTLSRSVSKKSYGFWHPALVSCPCPWPWDYFDIQVVPKKTNFQNHQVFVPRMLCFSSHPANGMRGLGIFLRCQLAGWWFWKCVFFFWDNLYISIYS